jgi:hypothetical protein
LKKKKKKKKKKKLQLIEQRIIRRTCTATATDFRGRSLEEEEEAGVVGAGEAIAAAEGKWRHLRDGKDTAASLESQWYAAEAAAAGVAKDGEMRNLAGSSNRRDAIVVVVAIADHTATKCKWRVRIATHTRVLGSFAARLSSRP